MSDSPINTRLLSSKLCKSVFMFCLMLGLLSCTGGGGQAKELDFQADVPEGGAIWLALDVEEQPGSTILDLHKHHEGQPKLRVFVSFQADWLVRIDAKGQQHLSSYDRLLWSKATTEPPFAIAKQADGAWKISLTSEYAQKSAQLRVFSVGGDAQLSKNDLYAMRIGNEAYLPDSLGLNAQGEWTHLGRYGAFGERPVIYQMLPRLFGNDNDTRKINGTMEENGVGKFSDLSESILKNLKGQGYSHIWLTGLLQQATSTDYSAIGQPADDPDLLKGIAGSPYAIKDYFDVCPDYADDPARRLEEFRALVQRMHDLDMKVLIDLVPNHVARSYNSDIRPEATFGRKDDKGQFFHPQNNFFYLEPEDEAGDHAPLKLPTVNPETGEVVSGTARIVGGADGLYPPEARHGRVTGNNVARWQPGNGDWYETVKLNYGYNYRNPQPKPDYPSSITQDASIPPTWKVMDEVIAYWQSMGVDGFRSDMSHMVPPEFWKWAIHRAQQRNPDVFFMAEAYNDDPAKVQSREPTLSSGVNVMVALLDAGFHAVYDDPGYDKLMDIYERGAWANDLQDVEDGLGPFYFDCSVRYAENHDEVRLASPGSWAGNGMEVGRPITATLLALSRGPVMVYHGQEVGEPALGNEGFGGDDQRTTIFDYWSIPELNKWWNGGQADGGLLSEEQKELHAWYGKLQQILTKDAFTRGNSYPLNHANVHHDRFGRIGDISHSGQWIYAYLRHDPASGETYLVASNLHADHSMKDVRVWLTDGAKTALHRLDTDTLSLRDEIHPKNTYTQDFRDALERGIYLKEIPAMSASIWRIAAAGN